MCEIKVCTISKCRGFPGLLYASRRAIEWDTLLITRFHLSDKEIKSVMAEIFHQKKGQSARVWPLISRVDCCCAIISGFEQQGLPFDHYNAPFWCEKKLPIFCVLAVLCNVHTLTCLINEHARLPFFQIFPSLLVHFPPTRLLNSL